MKQYPVPIDQSVAARRRRLFWGYGCPIHGGVMSQDDDWYEDDPFGIYTLVACSRNNCQVRAKAYSVSGPWELLPEFAHLIETAGDRTLVSEPPRRKRASRRKVWPILADQSPLARRARVHAGRCPIHGERMGQLAGWYLDDRQRRFTIVGCTLNDCQARARMYSMEGPWVLVDDCVSLLD